MNSKYISINILENLIKETNSKTVKNLCRKAIFNITNNADFKNNSMSDYMNKERIYLLYENDELYKFIG
jgi:hypothetical protein